MNRTSGLSVIRLDDEGRPVNGFTTYTKDDFLKLNARADIIQIRDDGRIEAVYLTSDKTGWREFPWAATLDDPNGYESRRVLDDDEAARLRKVLEASHKKAMDGVASTPPPPSSTPSLPD